MKQKIPPTNAASKLSRFPWPILFCWAAFLILLRRVGPYEGIFIGDEMMGTAAYAWIHQIPNMMRFIPHLRLFGLDVPAMCNTYHGPWDIYFLTPFVALGGGSLATLRTYSAMMFLLALGGTWSLSMLSGGGKAQAFLSTFLLAVCPAMITTHSMLLSEPDIAGAVWTLCFGVLFVRTRKPIYAYAAVCSFFAALCTRSWVAGLGVGLLLFAVLNWRRIPALLPESSDAKARLIAACLACAGVFLLPIVAYNAANGWPTLRFYLAHVIARSPSTGCHPAGSPIGTCSNLDYWTNLKLSISQIALLWDGNRFEVIKREPWHWLYVVPLLLSFFDASMESWRRKTFWSVPAMLWITVFGYLLISPVSPTEQMANHLFPLAPVLCVLVFSWTRRLPVGTKRAATLAVMSLICATQFSGDFHLLRRRNVDLPLAGEYRDSALIIDVCRWAEARPKIPVITFSLPFALAAPYFSQNRIRLIAWDGWMPPDQAPWRRWLRRKDRPYFVFERGDGAGRFTAELKESADRMGVRLDKAKIFKDPLGRPAFTVYRATP